MTQETFVFKKDCDMNELAATIGNSLAATIGVNPNSVQCKGVRIFYVDTESNTLMSSGLFVKGFSPEEWDDDNDV